jgi:hypothetical protein
MNVTFKDDIKNNCMKMTIKIEKRKFVRDERVSLGWPQIKKLVSESYNPPSTHTLGPCLNPGQGIDNSDDQLREWNFELLPKFKQEETSVVIASAKKPSRRKTKKKTAAEK